MGREDVLMFGVVRAETGTEISMFRWKTVNTAVKLINSL
jgi:hypothetical protein